MEREAREEAVRRLRSIEGHVRGIERMLSEGSCCLDVIRQTLAVRRALDRVGQLLVSSHLRQCMASEAGSDPSGEGKRALDELLEVLELSGRL